MDEIYATSHFLGPEHPLWRHSDSGMHWDCFENWDHRKEFTRELIAVVTERDKAWGWDRALAGQHCSVLLSLIEPDRNSTLPALSRSAAHRDDPKVVLWLHEAGVSFDMLLSEWAAWLSGTHKWSRTLLQRSWDRAYEELKDLSAEDLLARVDLDGVIEASNTRASKETIQSQERQSKRATDLKHRNEDLQKLLIREPSCPHCGANFELLKYYDNRANDRLSCVICQKCARSSRAEEFNGEIAF